MCVCMCCVCDRKTPARRRPKATKGCDKRASQLFPLSNERASESDSRLGEDISPLSLSLAFALSVLSVSTFLLFAFPHVALFFDCFFYDLPARSFLRLQPTLPGKLMQT